jgi:hypothetical protein
MRQTDRGRYFSDQTVGIIYKALIDDANTVEDTGIGIGSVWEGGPGHYPEYHYKNILAIIRESLCGNLSDYDFDITGDVTGGKITLSANLYERKGRDPSGPVVATGWVLASAFNGGTRIRARAGLPGDPKLAAASNKGCAAPFVAKSMQFLHKGRLAPTRCSRLSPYVPS